MNRTAIIPALAAALALAGCLNLEMTYHNSESQQEADKEAADVKANAANAQARAEQAAREAEIAAEKAAKAAEAAAAAAAGKTIPASADDGSQGLADSGSQSAANYRVQDVRQICKDARKDENRASAKYLDTTGVVTTLTRALHTNSTSVTERNEKYYKAEISVPGDGSDGIVLEDYHKISNYWSKGEKVRIKGHIEDVEVTFGRCIVTVSNRDAESLSMTLHY